jgi:hypothetical protein
MVILTFSLSTSQLHITILIKKATDWKPTLTHILHHAPVKTTKILQVWFGFRFMVFNATFNNISAISWRSVLFVEETGGPGENHNSLTNFITQCCTPRPEWESYPHQW